MRRRSFIFATSCWARRLGWRLAAPLWAAVEHHRALARLPGRPTNSPRSAPTASTSSAIRSPSTPTVNWTFTTAPPGVGRATWATPTTTPPTTTYNSFVKFDPSGQSIWVGYTVGGDINDQIYQVTNL